MGLGVVVIGRNEGERLVRCLDSLGSDVPCVYVDSGSTDRSVASAQERRVDVVELDMAKPFTAARARNEGFKRLDATVADLEYVMFVDGDCAVASNWLVDGLNAIKAAPDIAVVCGRRREQFPRRTIYNQLCDIEWDTPTGKANACGGDAIYRASAYRQVGGFNATLIAGEEPELCYRLRVNGHLIYRIDSDMTLHDAAMSRFGQWWKRAERSGHAYYLGYHLHGASAEKFRAKEVRSILAWGGLIPTLAAASVLSLTWVPLTLAIALFCIQSVRVSKSARRRGVSRLVAFKFGVFTMLGKLPQLIGVLRARGRVKGGKDMQLVEYK